jgi:MFS family permease
MLGDELAVITLMLRTEHDSGSGWAVSAILLASFVPIVVAGPLLAPLIDRIDHVNLISAVSVGQALAAAGLVWVRQPVLVLGLVAFIATGTAMVTPALLALIPSLCGDVHAARGYARLEASRNLGTIVGPALAGLLFAAGRGKVALLADAVSFLIIGVSIHALPQRPLGPMRLPGRWLEQVKAGASVVYEDAVLRRAVLTLLCAVVFITIANTVLVFYSSQVLTSGPSTYGWLVTAQAVGAFLVASKAATPLLRFGHLRVLVIATAILGISRVAMAIVPYLTVALVACLVAGACVTTENLALRDLIRSRVPADRRGRAFASVGSTLTAANIGGTAAGGPLASIASPVFGLLVSGIGTLTVATAAVLSSGRGRDKSDLKSDIRR